MRVFLFHLLLSVLIDLDQLVIEALVLVKICSHDFILFELNFGDDLRVLFLHLVQF